MRHSAASRQERKANRGWRWWKTLLGLLPPASGLLFGAEIEVCACRGAQNATFSRLFHWVFNGFSMVFKAFRGLSRLRKPAEALCEVHAVCVTAFIQKIVLDQITDSSIPGNKDMELLAVGGSMNRIKGEILSAYM